MKIAVSATGRNLDDPVDPRFGRAAYILIVDGETDQYVAIDNGENVRAFKGAGIQAATAISNQGAQVLLTGYCGPNAFKTLTAAGIKVVSDVSGTVRQVIDTFKSGVYSYSTGANADGHW